MPPTRLTVHFLNEPWEGLSAVAPLFGPSPRFCSLATLPPFPSAGGKGTPASSAQPEEIRDVGTSNIYDDDEKRENLKERHEELKDREKPVQLPANKGAGKKAVRGSTQAR